jgi:filamentous hemagglutinin
VADVRNSLAIPKEWKGRNGEKLYVIEFTVKPGAGVREGTVGPMFDTINKVELPGNGHQVNFMQNNPKVRPDLYRINLGSAKELK